MNLSIVFEDEDDFHLLTQVARRLGLELPEPKQHNLRGYNPGKLRSKLSTVAKTDFNRLVLVLDADREPEGGPKARWKEVLGAVRAAGISVPDGASTTDGLILDMDGDRRVAVWLFPDCKSEGAMEDFVLQRLVTEGDALLDHAATVVDGLPHKHFPLKFTQKARMRSWLAWQKRPGVPPGHAVSENVLTVSEARLERRPSGSGVDSSADISGR